MLPPDPPHSWCNFLGPDGQHLDTIHTADFWEWCVQLFLKDDGAHVYFYKRTAPNQFVMFGAFHEGLEKTEEWFMKLGVDIPALSRGHLSTGKMAKREGATDDRPADGVICGGRWHKGWDWLERWYAENAEPT